MVDDRDIEDKLLAAYHVQYHVGDTTIQTIQDLIKQGYDDVMTLKWDD